MIASFTCLDISLDLILRVAVNNSGGEAVPWDEEQVVYQTESGWFDRQLLHVGC